MFSGLCLRSSVRLCVRSSVRLCVRSSVGASVRFRLKFLVKVVFEEVEI